VKLLLAALAMLAGGAVSPPARVQVGAAEYSFTLSRPAIKAGTAIVELVNFGEDPHDLRLQRVGGTRVYAIGETRPGDAVDRTFKLLPGKYRLWCSIANHRRLGMQATLLVR
jgi:plastocyanin